MTPREYEEYVASLVGQLECFRSASIYRNHRFPGIRQPGEYEVDVALEMTLGGVARFLLIIECKLWTRPVDRPVIQKLAQTRDAIAAHKAAVVSPVGFSDEAVSVAGANGIALWVLADTTWIVVLGETGPDSWEKVYENLRLGLLRELQFVLPPEGESSILIDYKKLPKDKAHAGRYGEVRRTARGYSFEVIRGTAHTAHYSAPGINENSALWELANSMVTTFLEASDVRSDHDSPLDGWLATVQTAMLRLGLSEEQALLALSAVRDGDRERFGRAVYNLGSEALREWRHLSLKAGM